MPLVILFALMDDTYVWIWRYDTNERVKLHLMAGDMVVMRGDLAHCGCSYSLMNSRLHIYWRRLEGPRRAASGDAAPACSQMCCALSVSWCASSGSKPDPYKTRVHAYVRAALTPQLRVWGHAHVRLSDALGQLLQSQVPKHACRL